MIKSYAHITCKSGQQGLSGYVRAHAKSRSITWAVTPGPGGTMYLVEGDGVRPRFAPVTPAPVAVVPSPVSAWAS